MGTGRVHAPAWRLPSEPVRRVMQAVFDSCAAMASVAAGLWLRYEADRPR